MEPGRHATAAVHGHEHARGVVIVGLGVLVLSPDALLIRLVDAGAWDVLFWRTGLSALALLGVIAVSSNGRVGRAIRTMGRPGVLSTLLFCFSTIMFVSAIVHTEIANALAILSTAPIFAGVFGRIFTGERVALRTWLAIPVTLAGIALIFAGSIERAGIVGEAFALGCAMSTGANLVVLRRARATDMIPAICLGSGLACLISLPLASVPFALEPVDYAILAAMGAVQIPLSMVLILVVGTRYLPAAEVGLLMLVETVLGPLLAWLVVDERPTNLALTGVAVVIGTLLVHTALGVRETRRGRDQRIPRPPR